MLDRCNIILLVIVCCRCLCIPLAYADVWRNRGVQSSTMLSVWPNYWVGHISPRFIASKRIMALQWISDSELIALCGTSMVLLKCLNVPTRTCPMSLVRWTGHLQGMALPHASMYPKNCISVVMTKIHECRVIRESPKVSLVNCCLHEALQFDA